MQKSVQRGRNERRAEAYLRDMRDSGVVPDCVLYSTLINAYGRAGKPEEAQRVFDQLKSERHLIDAPLCGALMDALGRAGCVDRSAALFDEMPRLGIQREAAHYGALVITLCRAGYIERAYSLLAEMEREGLAIEIPHRSALLWPSPWLPTARMSPFEPRRSLPRLARPAQHVRPPRDAEHVPRPVGRRIGHEARQVALYRPVGDALRGRHAAESDAARAPHRRHARHGEGGQEVQRGAREGDDRLRCGLALGGGGHRDGEAVTQGAR